MAEVSRRPSGRPRVARRPGERSTLSLRITADLFEQLDQAAMSDGRPLSNEAEMRLQQSFVTQHLLDQVLDLNYRDPSLAAVLLILGETIRDATEEIGKRLHRPSGPDAGKNWLDQRYLFDQVAEALKTIMMILQPPEDTVPALPALYDGREITGKSIAAGIMHRVIAEWSQRYPWLTIRSRLSAEVIERISTRFNDEKIVGPTTTYATRLEDINRISNRRAGASHEGASR